MKYHGIYWGHDNPFVIYLFILLIFFFFIYFVGWSVRFAYYRDITISRGICRAVVAVSMITIHPDSLLRLLSLRHCALIHLVHDGIQILMWSFIYKFDSFIAYRETPVHLVASNPFVILCVWDRIPYIFPSFLSVRVILRPWLHLFLSLCVS